MAYLSADAHELLRELVQRLAAVEDHLAALRAGVASGADAALVAGVFAVAGLRQFTAAELLQMAARPGVPERALQALLAGRSIKGAGKLLRAAAGKPCSATGLVLTFEPSRCGNVWRVSHTRTRAVS